MSDDLEQQVMRDLRRTRRWERAHVWFIAVTVVMIALAWAAVGAYREWLIWTR